MHLSRMVRTDCGYYFLYLKQCKFYIMIKFKVYIVHTFTRQKFNIKCWKIFAFSWSICWILADNNRQHATVIQRVRTSDSVCYTVQSLSFMLVMHTAIISCTRCVALLYLHKFSTRSVLIWHMTTRLDIVTYILIEQRVVKKEVTGSPWLQIYWSKDKFCKSFVRMSVRIRNIKIRFFWWTKWWSVL